MLIFVILNLLNQFLAIFWELWHPLLTAIIFCYIFYFFVFFWREKKCELGNNPKMGYDSCPPLYNA
jgi:predicted PurR-regulated permease PerM